MKAAEWYESTHYPPPLCKQASIRQSALARSLLFSNKKQTHQARSSALREDLWKRIHSRNNLPDDIEISTVLANRE
jgi:hypothetical protein